MKTVSASLRGTLTSSMRAPLTPVKSRADGAGEPAAGEALGSTAYALKFSSPSLSLTYNTYFASRLHRNPPIGRLVSAVNKRAALNRSSVVFTHTLRAPFHGLIK